MNIELHKLIIALKFAHKMSTLKRPPDENYVNLHVPFNKNLSTS